MVTVLPVDYRDIEAALMRERHMRGTVMPRFTPGGWWECDVCELTPAGYFREYEIKMSRADFKADAGKGQYVLPFGVKWGAGQSTCRTKHDMLAAGDPRGPVNFYFVTPPGLLSADEIPAWAGWIEVFRRDDLWMPVEVMKKKAPRLHGQKAAASVKRNMRGSALGRLHTIWAERYVTFDRKRKEELPANSRYALWHPMAGEFPV